MNYSNLVYSKGFRGGIKKMIVGIIGAMECEITGSKEAMDLKEIKEEAMMKFYIGILEGVDTVVVCCGIGKVNAAIATQLLADKFSVNYIINVGVAGALSDNLEIGDIVISSDTTYHDFNPVQLVNNYPWMTDMYIKADAELINICQKACSSVLSIKRGIVGRVVSGDRFISSSETKKLIESKLSALCIEMEGASIAHVCHVNKIPFAIIRSISDKADESASMNFREFLQLASQQLSQLIIIVMKELKNSSLIA